MKNLFNAVKMRKPRKNFFDLTHDVKLSFNMGQLVPCCCMEAIPGDTFQISCQSLIRFAPMIAPPMHRMDVTIHYFFVPNRILWYNWQNYITGNVDPVTGLTPVAPYVFQEGTTANAWASGSLDDYLGIPQPLANNNYNISALPFAAYQRIYFEYYRDQNLIPAAVGFNLQTPPFALADGHQVNQDLITKPLRTLRIRAWEHDYFTASLPFAQKGTAVSLPLGNVVLNKTTPGTPQKVVDATTYLGVVGALTANLPDVGYGPYPGGPFPDGIIDPNGTLSVGATTINDLRHAFRLQEWLEKNARGGSRYIENILVHFGVASSDKRLQRPEYICGMKSPIIVSEIVNTGGDVATLPQGNMAGHGLSAGAGKGGKYFCEEHGWIIGIMSVMPKTAYMNGVPKHFLKLNDQFDYFWPTFAHLGEQPVLNAEIFSNNGAGTGVGQDSATFGYVPRYAEYKYMPSRVCGDFRTSLNFWHLARNFTVLPALNQTFIECVTDNRIFAVTDPATQHLYAHVLNSIKATRLMPKFGTPGGV